MGKDKPAARFAEAVEEEGEWEPWDGWIDPMDELYETEEASTK